MKDKEKKLKRIKRKARVRAKVKGTSDRPRVSVFRSNNHLFAQVIDDSKGITIAHASDKEISEKDKITGKQDKSFKIGEVLAKKTLDKKIKQVVFDKGGYKYHGRIKALAEGLRKGGLKV